MTCRHPAHLLVQLPLPTPVGPAISRYIINALDDLGASDAAQELRDLEPRASGIEWCSACGAWRANDRRERGAIGPWTCPEPRP